MNLRHEVQFSPDADGFTNSREALKRLLQNEGHEIHELKADLELVNYQNLKKFPQYLTSISHTQGAGAAILAAKSHYLSVGVDIEWSDRLMKEGTQRFYRHLNDSEYLNGLELWAMKEAAFKALSPLGFPGVLVLSKIIIQNEEFWSAEMSEIKGRLETFKIASNERELCLAVAYITKNY